MTYNPTDWQDQIVTDPTRYKIIRQDRTEELVNIEREPGEIIQEGTRITSDRLNNIEQGISDNGNEIDALGTQIAELEAELYSPLEQTISSSASVISLPATNVKGQLSDVSIKGRTVTNLLGDDGDCEDISNFETFQSNISLDNTKKVFGESSIKVELPYDQNWADILLPINLDTSKYYLVSAYVNISNLTDPIYGLLLRLTGDNISDIQGQTIGEDSTDTFKRTGFIINPNDIDEGSNFKIETRFKGGYIGQFYNIYGIMVNEITQNEYDNLTVDELFAKYNYVSGTKSTVLAQRLKSMGKNLFDESSVGRSADGRIPATWNGSKILLKNDGSVRAEARVKHYFVQGQQYIIQKYNEVITSGEIATAQLTELNSTLGIQSNPFFDSPFIFQNISGWYDVAVVTDHGSQQTIEVNIQLEKGTTATAYEEYQESISYIYTEDENGNILTANSLPNGIKNEVNEGKLYKRTNKYVLQSSDISLKTLDTNVDRIRVPKPVDGYGYGSGVDGWFIFEGWKESSPSGGYDNVQYENTVTASISTGNFDFIVPKGTYSTEAEARATFEGLTLIYQLATPITYNLPSLSNLYSFDGQTTIIIEPAIEFEAIADSSGQITITDANLPIAFVESVKEKIIDGDSISYTDADYTEVDTTTLGSLTQGRKYKVVYHYPQELTTIPELKITYPINIAASLSEVIDIQRRLENELGSVWITLLPLADKELGMYMITEITTPDAATAEDAANKINEILQVWKG